MQLVMCDFAFHADVDNVEGIPGADEAFLIAVAYLMKDIPFLAKKPQLKLPFAYSLSMT